MSAARELISRSGQSGKFWLGFGLILTGATALIAAGYLLGQLPNPVFFGLAALGTGVGLGGFAYLCHAIRCPACGAKWIWLMASRRPGSSGHWTWRSDRCSLCGYSG